MYKILEDFPSYKAIYFKITVLCDKVHTQFIHSYIQKNNLLLTISEPSVSITKEVSKELNAFGMSADINNKT